LDIPKKRGTFVEFRNGMVNVSPIGRNASNDERNEYEKYDKENGIRAKMVEALKAKFPDYGLTYVGNSRFCTNAFLTIFLATQLAAKSPSMSSRTAGTRRTALSKLKRRRKSRVSITRPSISSGTRASRVGTTMKSTVIRGRRGMLSMGPRIR
jgi:hypothetical protein